MTQSVLESMIAALKAELVRQEQEAKRARRGKQPVDYPSLARAALIALRDGVTADQATIEATLSDSEYGYGSFLEPFQNALNHVLQEGEKVT